MQDYTEHIIKLFKSATTENYLLGIELAKNNPNSIEKYWVEYSEEYVAMCEKCYEGLGDHLNYNFHTIFSPHGEMYSPPISMNVEWVDFLGCWGEMDEKLELPSFLRSQVKGVVINISGKLKNNEGDFSLDYLLEFPNLKYLQFENVGDGLDKFKEYDFKHLEEISFTNFKKPVELHPNVYDRVKTLEIPYEFSGELAYLDNFKNVEKITMTTNGMYFFFDEGIMIDYCENRNVEFKFKKI